MKICRTCCQEKPREAFAARRGTRDGLQSTCRACDTAKAKAWQAANWGRAQAVQKSWRTTNRERYNALMALASSKRRAAKKNRVPAWADAAKIAAVYRLAADVRSLGFDCDVDHIVPLQGVTASGFHTHDNLQVLPSLTNSAKRNTVDPDAYDVVPSWVGLKP